MTNSFLILFVTIKAEIARCEYKYTLCHMVRGTEIKKRILYTSLILSHHHSHIHISPLISLKKIKHIKGGKKKR